MRQYLDVLQELLILWDIDNDRFREDRTGVGTQAVFARPMRFKMRDGFPAVTTKKLAFNAVVGELLWFLEGSSDEHRLREIMGKDRTIWTPNAEADYWKPNAQFDGDVGRNYGVQWRSWTNMVLVDGHAAGHEWEEAKYVNQPIDQIARVIESIKTDPYSRRHVVTAWNPAEVGNTALPPCHMFFQFFVEFGELSLAMYQRSCDMFLGVPFNIASYALLLHMVAQVTGLSPGELTIILGDAHVYANHVEQVREQLTRAPYRLPELWLNPDVGDIDSFTMDDVKLVGYESHPPIKAPMAV